jgi:hypothetical protein
MRESYSADTACAHWPVDIGDATSRASSTKAARLRTLRRGGLGVLAKADRNDCGEARAGGSEDGTLSTEQWTSLTAANAGMTRRVAGEGEREGSVGEDD